MTTQTVTVQIDMADFSDEQIAEEYLDRDLGPDQQARREAMFAELQRGNDAEALLMLRQYLCDALGRVL